MTLAEIAERLDCRLEGDGSIEIARVAGLSDAGPGDITFLANPKYVQAAQRTQASAIILAGDAPAVPCAILRSAHPYRTFAQALALLGRDERPAAGVHPTAAVAPDARLGRGVSIGPFAVVGAGAEIGDRVVLHAHVVVGPGARIGSDTLVHPRVSIRDRSVIGARVIIQDGAVIGSDGFGFAPRGDGTYEKIPQTARVVIEDDVEIGANTTVDRPAVGETRIARGVKIDNLVQIAHGVVIGRNSLLAAQVGIAGSTRVGENVMFGGQVGVAGHVTVGDRAQASGKTGITGHVPAEAFLSGYPSMDNLEWRKAWAALKRLPGLKRRLAELEERLAKLEAED